jgi:hypothetical protein
MTTFSLKLRAGIDRSCKSNKVSERIMGGKQEVPDMQRFASATATFTEHRQPYRRRGS